MTDIAKTVTPLPAGSYWVGDPCYGFNNHNPEGDLWDEWLSSCYGPKNEVPDIMDGTVRGIRVVAATTAHGDGFYGNQFSVDSGMIGAINDKDLDLLFKGLDLKPVNREKFAEESGLILVDFDHDFHISYNDGLINIGGLSIQTDIWDDEF